MHQNSVSRLIVSNFHVFQEIQSLNLITKENNWEHWIVENWLKLRLDSTMAWLVQLDSKKKTKKEKKFRIRFFFLKRLLFTSASFGLESCKFQSTEFSQWKICPETFIDVHWCKNHERWCLTKAYIKNVKCSFFSKFTNRNL